MEDAKKVMEKVNGQLMPLHKGEFVAIETESGEFFLGKSDIEAYTNAAKKYPDKKFFIKRIGFASTYFAGASMA